MKRVMEMDDGDGYTLWMYSIPLHYTLKMIKMANFMLSIFYHNKKGRKINSPSKQYPLLNTSISPYPLCQFLSLWVTLFLIFWCKQLKVQWKSTKWMYKICHKVQDFLRSREMIEACTHNARSHGQMSIWYS